MDPELVAKLEECEKAISAIEEMGALYYIYAGKNQDIVKHSGTSLTAIAKRSWADEKTFERFTGIRHEGREVDPKNYEAVSGSVEIKLKAEYLDSLSLGDHKVTILFKDGSVELPFTISAKETSGGGSSGGSSGSGSGSKSNADPEPTSVPRTGDNANTVLWLGMILLGLLGLCAAALFIPKRKK